ncbi:uncharacterized protein FTOL_11638 [Fusarium torulosum]|uniref:Carrier domain-containing protein n=1 Tax=Fusarium torulosum TaxID=33205 RepID=A0AAE8SN69_9HYPO|nr:uncharacterized protein FTOL_11638 [Fusarium torulosum]
MYRRFPTSPPFVTLAQEQENTGGQKRRAGHQTEDNIVPKPLDEVVETRIRIALKAKLPSYMICRHAFTRWTEFRTILRGSTTGAAPSLKEKATVLIDEIETILCEKASAVLKVEVVTSSNFFEIGRHSLVAAKFTSFVGQRLGVRVSVKEVFDYPVIGDLAARLAPMPLQLEDSSLEPYQLLKGDDPEAFIDREAKPQLNQEDRDLIMDIYPATRVQKLFLQDE